MFEVVSGAQSVPRERLVTTILAAPHHVLIEAPLGYGKTALLREVEQRVSGATLISRRAGLEEHDSDQTLLIDFPLTTQDLEVIDAARIVVAARHLRRSVRAQLVQAGATVVTARDLRLDDDEVASLLSIRSGSDPSADEVRSVAGLTEGWPAAVAAIADYRSDDRSVNWSVYGPHLDDLVDAALAGLKPSARRDFAQLCHLGTFTKGCVDALPSLPDTVELIEDGCPLITGADGWIRVPRVLTLWAQSSHPQDQDTIRAVAPVLLATASPERALRALIGAGLERDAAVMMADLPERQIDHLGSNVGHALLDIAEPYLDELPSLHLFRARLYRNTAEFGNQAASLVRASESSDPHVAARARIELLVMQSRQGWSDEDERQLAATLEQAPSTGSTTATIAEIRAFAAAHDAHPRIVRGALAQFERAAAAWELQGDVRRAASVLRGAVTTSLFHLGEHHDAARLLERAADLCWNYPFDRAVTTVFRCRVASLSAATEDFERLLPEAEALVAATQLDWMRAYLEWSLMWAAVWRSDRRSVMSHHRDATQFLGELIDTPTGHLFMAESASCFAIVGAHDEATQLLCELSGMEGTEIERRLAELVVTGRSGTGAGFDAIAEQLLDDPEFPVERHWRVWVEQLRRLDPADPQAAVLTSDVNKYSERQGLGALRDLLLQDPTGPGGVTTARVSVLGGFGVEAEGAEIDPPAGHVVTTVKVLAIYRGSVAVDRLVDILWPEAWIDEGRQRLKNVVKRVRDSLGADAIVRRSDEIAFGSNVAVDLIEFYDAARSAMLTSPDERDDMVRQIVRALGLYRGELLPNDHYEDFALPARQSARAQAEALFAQLYGVPSSQRPPASWLLSTLLTISPDDDGQLTRVARLALDEGDHATARSALRMAKIAARAVDVDLVVDDDELEAIVAMI